MPVAIATAITVATAAKMGPTITTGTVPEARATIAILDFMHRSSGLWDGANTDLSRRCLSWREEHAGCEQARCQCRYFVQWLTPGSACELAALP